MSQIDQAFIKAYAKDRARASFPTTTTPQALPQQRSQQMAAPVAQSNTLLPSQQAKLSIPMASQSAGSNLFAHAPSPIAAPHASVAPKHPTASYPTARSAATAQQATTQYPVQQTFQPPTVQVARPNAAKPEPSIHPTSAASRQRSSSTVRIDPPTVPMPTSPIETSLQTTRKTLSSYFQQARGNVDLAPPPAIPSIPTRWSKNEPQASLPTSPQLAPKAQVAPTAHESVHTASNHQVFNDSVDRGEEYNAWQFQVVERGVKSNSTSDGPSAKIRNPGKPNSFIRIDRPHHETQESNPFTRPLPAPVQHFVPPTFPVPNQPVSQRITQPSSYPTVQAQSQNVVQPTAYHHSEAVAPVPTHASIQQPSMQSEAVAVTATAATFIHTPVPKSFTKTASTKPLTENIAKLALPVTPTWEVDEFLWPATVSGLMQNQPDAIRDIGLHLQHASSNGLRTLAITSGERGVGRSTVAMCIAKAVSKTGLRVALVDCDCECPSLVDQLNLEVAHGWQECILNNVPLDEVAVHAVKEKITFFPLLSAWSNSQVEQHQIRINKLLKRIALGYDLVILDCNRIHGKQQTLCGLGDEQVIDAALVIVDAQLSLRQRVDGAIETLRRSNINSIGIAENFHSQG
ncbi:MAG: P-loop NTPase [Planctomycetota bacterium]|nr:P-loop NTPase [Planctomycetota bacterium]